MTDLYIQDLMDFEDLQKRIDEKYVNVQTHPDLPLSIYNYSDKCMHDDLWDNITENCRGLIVETESGRVIARGPKKFWNANQKQASHHALEAPVTLSRKEDGSAGIAWLYDGQMGVATRGSFASDQADHATKRLQDDDMWWLREALQETVNTGETPFVEIVFPENRIVLNYQGLDTLVPLGYVNHETGLIHTRNLGANIFRQPKVMTLAEAIALSIPNDEEGYVVDVLEPKTFKVLGHVKLKGDFYKMLHAILTNTSGRKVWVQMAGRAVKQWVKRDEDWASLLGHDPAAFSKIDFDKPFSETLTDVPDEFMEWVEAKQDEIQANVDATLAEWIKQAGELEQYEGRERYEKGKQFPNYKNLNNYLKSEDNRYLVPDAWRAAKPAGNDLPFIQDEG